MSSSYRTLNKTIFEGIADVQPDFRAEHVSLCRRLSLCGSSGAGLPQPARPWMNRALSADERAALVVQQLTQDEKLSLVFGWFATDADWKNNFKAPAGRPHRLGRLRPRHPAARHPAAVADRCRRRRRDAGRRANEARAHRAALRPGDRRDLEPGHRLQGRRDDRRGSARVGFNVMLAGGVNLLRDPRNGRNFEYGGEDPLLAGTIVGAQIAGIQSNHIISTDQALCAQRPGDRPQQPTMRRSTPRGAHVRPARLPVRDRARRPGSVMCSYNRVNGTYACENTWLLTEVLRARLAASAAT